MTERFAYILDDEQQVGVVIAKMLVASGFYPELFSETHPFFAALKRKPPELIVLDLALGRSDAVEVIRHLEVLRYAGKVLLVSGRDEVVLGKIKDIGKSHGLSMLPPLQKPFRLGDLKQSLGAAVEAPAEKTMAVAIPVATPAKIDLGEALTKRWLELWYQPKIDLKSMKPYGAEALLRARHPEYGIISPAAILPTASDPLYLPLTNFVVGQALADWTHFSTQGATPQLSVNVPVSVLQAADFIPEVRKLLPKDRNFPGLIMEVTEDEVVRDPELLHEIAAQLRLYNVTLSIDDFGSGYSSLARLRDFPCAEVKLDRSFVLDCSTDGAKQSICSAAIELAHSFGATVCAEGVETAEDLMTLIALRCDTAQGYLFGKPMPAETFLGQIKTASQGEVAGSTAPAGRLARYA